MKKLFLYGFVALICIAFALAMKYLILATTGVDISAKNTEDYVMVVVVSLVLSAIFSFGTKD